MAHNNTNDWWSNFFGDNNSTQLTYNDVDSDNEECYDILGIDKTAKLKDIEKAFRLKITPMNNDPNKSKEISHIHSAYQILSDEKTRKLYDEGGLLRLKKNQTNNYLLWIYSSTCSSIIYA